MTKHSKQRLAIDMDEVLADTLARFLSVYNQEFGEQVTKADLAGRRLTDLVKPELVDHVRGYARRAGYFRDIALMPGCVPVVAELLDRYEVFIATAAMEYPNSFTEKYEWIKEHFPAFPDSHIVFCGDKSIISTDFLIDDSPRHFDRYAGQGFLFTAPHNLNETRYPRLNDWDEVRRQFLDDGK